MNASYVAGKILDARKKKKKWPLFFSSEGWKGMSGCFYYTNIFEHLPSAKHMTGSGNNEIKKIDIDPS